MNEYEIDKNHDIQAKPDNKKLGKKWVKKNCDILLARKLKCPSSARLETSSLD